MKKQNTEIYNAAGLTPAEISDMPRYIGSITGETDAATYADFYDSESYDKLYEYFAFESNEMPYGVAKARTGEPDIWILEYLENNRWENV